MVGKSYTLLILSLLIAVLVNGQGSSSASLNDNLASKDFVSNSKCPRRFYLLYCTLFCHSYSIVIITIILTL